MVLTSISLSFLAKSAYTGMVYELRATLGLELQRAQCQWIVVSHRLFQYLNNFCLRLVGTLITALQTCRLCSG